MPKYVINVHEREDGSLPIDKWVTIENEDHVKAIEIACDMAITEGKIFNTPFNVFVSKGRMLWSNGIPQCCVKYKIEEIIDESKRSIH